MRPERSLVLLLVLAGAGQGIFIFLAAMGVIIPHLMDGAHPEVIYSLGISSLAFTLAGMAASLFHLGNPLRGWKAVIRWQSSWLSREALFMGLFSGCAALYPLVYFLNAPYGVRALIGIVGICAAFALYIASAMLYARIRFVREWSNKLTITNFVFFGFTSGGAVTYAILCLQGVNYIHLRGIMILLAAGSLILKTLAFVFNKTVYVPTDIKNALVMNDPDIRLMSTGTSYEHYNTKEYSSGLTDAQVRSIQLKSLFAAFIIPMILWMAMPLGAGALGSMFAVLAAVAMIAGLLMERRLFFIQGNHLQNLYYARFRGNDARNPLLSKAKKGTPVPLK